MSCPHNIQNCVGNLFLGSDNDRHCQGVEFQHMRRQGSTHAVLDNSFNVKLSRRGGVRTLKHGLQLRLLADGGPGLGRASRANGNGHDSAIHAGCRGLVREELAIAIPVASHPIKPSSRCGTPAPDTVCQSLTHCRDIRGLCRPHTALDNRCPSCLSAGAMPQGLG
jgi:hypothetical protein